jgi:hypothetical protein
MRKGLVKVLGVLQVLIGLGAVGGGLGLVMDPSGGNLGIPLELLEDSPFATYLIPGIVLLTVNGLGSLAGAAASFRGYRYAGKAAMALGAFLVVWIVVQAYWIGVRWLHALYLGLGALELVLGLAVCRGAKART